jgi:NADH dehydrogenase
LTNSCLQASDNVFALGDSAWIEVGGKVASKTAVEAEHQAKQTAKNLWRYAEGRALKEYAILAPTNSPVALISLGCDSAVGVYGSMCITMPSRVIHALKGWIDKSFIDHFK